MTSTIDPKEVEKFSRMADEWWDKDGKFMPLHKFNPIRVDYIKESLISHFNLQDSQDDLSNLEILDIGCGGGLICEPFSGMKANITGIDASEKNIEIAKSHADKSGLEINYQATSAEELAKKNKKYDAVFALEIIEHVADVEEFVKSCSALVKEGGLFFVATLNRTAKSLLLAKFATEYVLRWVPIGTHDWNKFLKPSQINAYANDYNLNLKDLMGFSYNPISSSWKMNSSDLSINYAMCFVKK